jgi:hypothetical protein
MPLPPINKDEIISRLRQLANAAPCERCDVPVAHAVADITRLLTHVSRLYAALTKERMRSANLEAAIRSALGAESDGEIDPLAYLRSEIPDYAGGDAYGA